MNDLFPEFEEKPEFEPRNRKDKARLKAMEDEIEEMRVKGYPYSTRAATVALKMDEKFRDLSCDFHE